MKSQSIRSILTSNYKRFIAAGILCFTTGAIVPATAGATSSPEVSAKVQVGAPNAEATPAADPIRACGPAPRDKDSSAWGKYFKSNGVNIRRSPSTSATKCAQGQKSHKVDYHCWAFGSDGRTWTYLRDVTTRYAGWVRDDQLAGYGSSVRC